LPKNTKSFPSFNLKYERNDLVNVRVEVVVSKNVHKKATVRNLLRRKMLGHVEKIIGKERGFDLVFFIKRKALDIANMADEVESVADLLEEI
jgi:ribonuclease P protein component